MNSFHLLFFTQLLANLWFGASAACYFPQEFQGEYTMQSTTATGNTIQYSTLNITDVAIPIWGNCHDRIGYNFILKINFGENSCIRCLHLRLRSKNVLQVLTSSQETISQCYISKELTKAKCPTEESLRNREAAEIILFKTKDREGNPIREEYCPLDDAYTVDYKRNDVTSNRRDCIGQLNSCPSGSTFNLRFRKCAFSDMEVKYDCLGSWDGPQDEKFVILSNKNPQNALTPKYRCGIYKRDPLTGVVNLALGRDSTCRTDLHNATSGFETMVLRPKEDNNWPHDVVYTQCSFPEWMNGYWEHVRVEDNTLTYRDHTSFKTYTIKCAAMLDTGDKFVVFRRTQCNEDHFTCMKIQKRSNNILEFQLSSKNLSHMNDINALCDESNFDDDAWITQGRLEPNHGLACPISGEYEGKIPDSDDLCAKLWSGCKSPELMYYQVFDCRTSEIYEEREYKCLGHWREANLLYTYTQRHDIVDGTYECFVGSIRAAQSLQEDIYIKEAGEHCQRNEDPIGYGMKLTKQGAGLYSCVGYESTATSETPRPTTTSPITRKTTTKPWSIAIPYPTIPDNDNTLNGATANLWVVPFVNTLLLTIVIRLL